MRAVWFVALSQLVFWVTPAHARIVDRVAAIAGSHVIMLSEVQARAAVYLVVGGDKDPLVRARAQAQAMRSASEALIDDELIDDEASRVGISVTDDDIDRALDSVAKQNGLDRAALLTLVRDQHANVDDYRDMLRDELLEQRILLLRKVESKVFRADLRAHAYVEDRVAAP